MAKQKISPGTIYFERWVPAPPSFIRYQGMWDMQDLYQSIADWFRLKKYKFNEDMYEHRPPTPFGRERYLIWFATRKDNEYTQVRYDIYLHTWDTHDAEVATPDGEKKTFSKGRLWIELKVVILYDFEKRWDTKVFFRYMKEFYNKYVIKKKSEYEYSPKFRTEMFELHAMIKNRLKFESDEFEHKHHAGVYVRT